MEMIYCGACAEQISKDALACPKCGHPNPYRSYAQTPGGKSRVTAGLLAILVGGLGVHKFYLEKIGMGFLYLVFCWTFVPAVIALIEGIVYLTQDDKTFGERQGVRVQPS